MPYEILLDMKEDIGHLQSDVSTIKECVDKLTNDMSELKELRWKTHGSVATISLGISLVVATLSSWFFHQ